MKIVDKPCERCGEMLFRVPSIQKYCQTCRKAVEIEHRQATNEKRREERKKLTVEKHCVNCGKTFETSRGNKSIAARSANAKRKMQPITY